MPQDPALSQFHSGNRYRLFTGSGRNKPNAFLNYSHLPKSPMRLEAPPHCAPWVARLVLTPASAPQGAILCVVPLSHLLQILCCISHFAKWDFKIASHRCCLFFHEQTRCDRDRVCLWKQVEEWAWLPLRLFLASVWYAWSQPAPQTFTGKPTALITRLQSK